MADKPSAMGVFGVDDMQLLAGGLLAAFVTGNPIMVAGEPWNPPAKLIGELFGDDWTQPEAKPADDEIPEPGFVRMVARKVAFAIAAAGEILDRLRLETSHIAAAIARSNEAAESAAPAEQGGNLFGAGGVPGAIGDFARANESAGASAQSKSNSGLPLSSQAAFSADTPPESPGSAGSAPAPDALARAAAALPPLARLSSDSAADAGDFTQPEKE